VIEVRQDYDPDVIKKWWKDRQKVEFDPELLSASGFTGYYDEQPVATIFLYPTIGSKIAWLGWPISDKEVNKNLRDLVLDEILEEIHVFARSKGYKYIWTTTGLGVVKERLLRHNYLVGDEDICQLWRFL